MQKQHKFEN